MTVKTFTPKIQTKSAKRWILIDAENQTLGRLATKIAVILRGKDKATFTPHLDMGDYVVVINAEKIKVTGKKEEQMLHYSHSGYLGHLKSKPIGVIRQQHPDRILYQCVAGMVPRNKMKKFVLDKLKIYKGAEHPHAGQNLITL